MLCLLGFKGWRWSGCLTPTLGCPITHPDHAIVLCHNWSTIPQSLHCAHFCQHTTISTKGHYGVLWWCTLCDNWRLLWLAKRLGLLLLSSSQPMRSTTKDVILLVVCVCHHFRGFTHTLWDQIEACNAGTYLAFGFVWSTLFIINSG